MQRYKKKCVSSKLILLYFTLNGFYYTYAAIFEGYLVKVRGCIINNQMFNDTPSFSGFEILSRL